MGGRSSVALSTLLRNGWQRDDLPARRRPSLVTGYVGARRIEANLRDGREAAGWQNLVCRPGAGKRQLTRRGRLEADLQVGLSKETYAQHDAVRGGVDGRTWRCRWASHRAGTRAS